MSSKEQGFSYFIVNQYALIWRNMNNIIKFTRYLTDDASELYTARECSTLYEYSA